MNVDEQKISSAKAKAMMSTSLRKACKAWYEAKKTSPYPEAKSLGEWIEKELRFLALMTGQGEAITVDALLYALRVELLGEPLAVALAENARRNGWKTELYSYIEDGWVFSRVFVSGKSAEENKNEAYAIQSTFSIAGQDAKVELADSDIGEYCVCASIEFAKSIPKGRGGR